MSKRNPAQMLSRAPPLLSKLARAALGGPVTLGLLGSALSTFAARLREDLEARRLELRPDLEKRFGEGTRDIVEEASWESFPASDAPPR